MGKPEKVNPAEIPYFDLLDDAEGCDLKPSQKSANLSPKSINLSRVR